MRQFRLPGDYSCICSFELLEKAVAAAREKNLRFHVGNLLCSDMFYTPNMPQIGTSWSDMGVLAVEMESAALYSNAAAAGVNALCIVTISGLRHHRGGHDRQGETGELHRHDGGGPVPGLISASFRRTSLRGRAPCAYICAQMRKKT